MGFMSKEYIKIRDWDSSKILPPLVVSDERAISWDETADMLVVGYGAAGASTALEGHARGLYVVLADRFQGGGASELSGGIVYAGGGTKAQREAGHGDTPEAMFEYLSKEVGSAVSSQTLRRFCDDSVGTLDWLENHGAHFGGPEAPHKTSYPGPHDFLYYSDNATAPAYAGRLPPAPRGHRTMGQAVFENPEVGQGEEGGFHLMAALKKAVARASNIRVLRQAKATRLIVNPQNEVLGVEFRQLREESFAGRLHKWAEPYGKNPLWRLFGFGVPFIWLVVLTEKFAKPIRVRARHGTVLSAGGFVHNRKLVSKVAPEYLRAPPLGSLGCDGSGVRLGLTVGAGTGWMDSVSAWRFVNPPYAWVKGIVVGPDGNRLVNEELYGAVLGQAMYRRTAGRAWLIVDGDIQAAAIEELKEGKMFPFQRYPIEASRRTATKADSIAELESKLGFPIGSLVNTVSSYNAAIAQQTQDAMGKSPKLRAPLQRKPYYAVNLKSSLMSPAFSITMGGLSVDEETGQVTQSDGSRINGLFAAGRSAVGLPSKNYVSGLSLADCVWSGRRAARSIASLRDHARR